MPIEPRIRPLVDALNETGIVQTFTSCEGHYADGPAGTCRGREQANVGFFLRVGVPERELVRLFGEVVAELQLRGVAGAELAIAKHCAPSLDGQAAEVFFDFTIRPLDARSSTGAKREVTDRCLAVVAAAVERASRTAGRPEDRRAELEGILAAHEAWKRRLADAIAGAGTITVEDAGEDGRCAVGEWLHRAPELRAQVPLRRIAALHARFHEEASTALRLARAAKDDEARRRVEPRSAYARASADLAEALRSLAA